MVVFLDKGEYRMLALVSANHSELETGLICGLRIIERQSREGEHFEVQKLGVLVATAHG
jgi:hypothetical protein